MKKKAEGFSRLQYVLLAVLTVGTVALCVCVGSVNVPLTEAFSAIVGAILGRPSATTGQVVIAVVRLPRVLCVALVGAALAMCGAAMQGLLRNSLADGSTLGVSSGASLGAVLAIAFGLQIPGLHGGGVMAMAMLFALLSLLCILGLANALDYSLATNTVILIGVIFSMFANSIISLVVTFAGEKVRPIVFWTMGSLASSSYVDLLAMVIALAVCGPVLFAHARELNAFAVGEENAGHVGVNVRRVKLVVLIAVAVLIGVCVSVGGSIGFVGLVIPHITRMITGPNHRRLLPASMFTGAVFLLLADLVSRMLLSPRELPIGVVTSIVGAVVFVYIFYTTRRGK